MSNLTVFETLKQPTNADGSLKATIAPTRLVENYIDKGRLSEHIDGTFTLDNVTYQPKQTAITAAWLVANINNLSEAFRLAEQGFCTTKQAETAAIIIEKGIAKTKPLEGHYLTSDQYLESCYTLLPELPTPTFEDIQAKLSAYKPSMNKTELVSIIEDVIALCTPKVYTVNDLTNEQFAKYIDLQDKENALATATNVLSMYLDSIVPVKGSDIAIQGRFYPERGQGNELVTMLEQEGWKILVSTPVPAKLDSNFAVTEPGYILMSINVVREA